MNATAKLGGAAGFLWGWVLLLGRRRARWPAAAVAVGALLLAWPAAAPAAAVARAQPAKRLILIDEFMSVSCPARHMCVAVGDAGIKGRHLLAERWNGRRWSVMHLAVPAGATSGGLTGVSCSSATACTAVGLAGLSSGSNVLVAERWNGRRWHLQPIPAPGGGGV